MKKSEQRGEKREREGNDVTEQTDKAVMVGNLEVNQEDGMLWKWQGDEFFDD